MHRTSKRKAGQRGTNPALYKEPISLHPQGEDVTPWPIVVERRIASLESRVAELEDMQLRIFATAKEMKRKGGR